MHKKVVVLGGGKGSSGLLKGLKEFPVDITAVITVSDNGKSTGVLREEFQIPAVGDIRRVISNLSNIDPVIQEMIEYRFNTNSYLNGHALGNLIFTAMIDITGSLKESIKYLSKLLDVKHTVLPLSEEEDLTLMGETIEGDIIEGEHNITESGRKYKRIFYKTEPKVLPEVIDSIMEADLVIISMGSLFTSVFPHILCKSVIETLEKTNAKIMYICNAVTQPGETDGFGVSDHVKMLSQYLKNNSIDVVIASNSKIDEKIALKYQTEENKDPVYLDAEKVKELGIELLEDDLVVIDENRIRHNSLKLGNMVFSYLMRD